MRIERVDFDDCPWDVIDRFDDRNVFQTREWLRFVSRISGAQPVILALHQDGAPAGWFTGFVRRYFGLKALGSPFPNQATSYLGFNLAPEADERLAYTSVAGFAFAELHCVHVEIRSRQTGFHTLDGTEFTRARTFRTSTLVISDTEDAIFAGFNSACRRAVRKASREGVSVEEAEPAGFAEEHFDQLLDVFDKQGLRPHYDVDRVRAVIEEVHQTGNLMLLRARDPGGRSIATGIFPRFNGAGHFWSGASYRADQILRPNDALMWDAIRRMRKDGIAELDLGGRGDYKAKFNPIATPVPGYQQSRARWVSTGRHVAERAYRRFRGMSPVPAPYVPDES
jgi:hypothetical protein